MEQRIEITINEDASLEAQTLGFQGETCLEEIENILGKEFSNIQKTDEFYQKKVNVNQQGVSL